MVMAITKASSASGRFTENPFVFLTADVSSIQLYLDDKQVTPGFKLKYSSMGSSEKSDFIDGLESLYRESTEPGDELPSSYCRINRENYCKGYCLYMVKFNDGGKFLPVQPHANLKINIDFKTAPLQNLMLYMYARFPSVMTIDKSRRVTV